MLTIKNNIIDLKFSIDKGYFQRSNLKYSHFIISPHTVIIEIDSLSVRVRSHDN